MLVLSLDIATTCGVALGEAGATPRAWTVDLGKGASDRARFAKSIRMARHYCEKFKPDLVAVEAPVGGPKTSHLLVGMWACVIGEIENAGIASMKCDISSVRKHFLGVHLTTKHYPGLSPSEAKKQIKLAVVNRCKLLGWQVDGHDAADSCAIWDYACALNHSSHHTTTIGGLFSAT